LCEHAKVAVVVSTHIVTTPAWDMDLCQSTYLGLGLRYSPLFLLPFPSKSWEMCCKGLIAIIQDLVDELKSELSGDFEKVILGLMMTPADYDAYCVKDAVKGLGTDERALIEVLCSRNNEQMQAMKAAYKKREE
jgi:annexin A7/11